VFSNGILILAAAATALLVAFRANINSLIPLYAIGVFISFTLSQAGMTRRHLRLREPGWRYGLVVNGIGTVVTFVVLLDVISTKFTHGAWMILVALPILVVLLYRTNRAYSGEIAELKIELSATLAPPKPRHEVVVLVEGLDRATLAAVQAARQLQGQRAVALHVAVDAQAACGLQALWAKLQIPLPLEVVRPDSLGLGATVARVVAGRARPDTEVTVLLPRRAFDGLLDRLRRGRRTDALLAALGALQRVHVTAVPRVAPPDQRRHRLLHAAGNGDGQAATALDELLADAVPALAPPKPATRWWCSSRASIAPRWGRCSTPPSCTRCPPPPYTWPSTPTRPDGWPNCGPRSTSRSRWRSSTAPTATCSPAPSKTSMSACARTPSSPFWCRGGGSPAGGTSCCSTTAPQPAWCGC
jgi:uncharacterized membrane protein